MLKTNESFVDACKTIAANKKSKDFFVKFFNLPPNYTPDDVDKAYRKVIFKFHPDKVSEDYKKLATETFRVLENAKQHLKGLGELASFSNSVSEYIPVSALNYRELLDRLEATTGQDGKIIDELKQRLIKQPGYIECTSRNGDNILHLIIKFNQIQLLDWLVEKQAPKVKELLLSEFDIIMPMRMLMGDRRHQLLGCLQSNFGQDWLVETFLKMVKNTKETWQSCLEECITWLHNHQIEIPITVQDNPLLLNTVLGSHLSEQDKNSIIKNNLFKYPNLYLVLTPDQQNKNPSSFIVYCYNSRGIAATLAIFSRIDNHASPYYIKALLETFPETEDIYNTLIRSNLNLNLHFSKLRNTHTYRLLNLQELAAFIAYDILFALMGYLAYAYPLLLIPEGVPILLFTSAVMLPICLAITAYLIYGQIKKYQAKHEINATIKDYNFFKSQTQAGENSLSAGKRLSKGVSEHIAEKKTIV